MWKIKINSRVLVVFILLFAGCTDDVNLWNPDPSTANIVAVGNVVDQFGFAVSALKFSFEQEYSLNFTTDSVKVGIALMQYQAGSGKVRIYGDNEKPFYEAELTGNLASGDFTLTSSRPKKIKIELSGISGQLSISVSKSK